MMFTAIYRLFGWHVCIAFDDGGWLEMYLGNLHCVAAPYAESVHMHA
jgi:hypothetical protein